MANPSAPLPPVEPILAWPEVRPLIGNIGRTTAWRLIRAGQLPKPVHISPGRIGWRLGDIRAFQERQAAAAGLQTGVAA